MSDVPRNRGVTACLVALLAGPALVSCAGTPGRERPLDPVMATAACAGGQTMAVSTITSEVALFDVAPLRFRSLLTREEAKTKPTAATIMRSPPVACSPDAKLIVAAGLAGAIVGWEADTGSVRFRVSAEGGTVGLAFLPDGRSFVTVGPAAIQRSSEDGSVVGEFKPEGGATATSVAVSPDGRVILVGLSSGEIAEIDALARQVLRVLKGHRAPVTGIAFSPDGSAFASTAGRYDPRIWNRTEDSPLPRKLSEAGGIGESLEKAGRETQAIALFAWLLVGVQSFRIVGAPTLGTVPVMPTLERAAQEPSPYCRPSVAYSPDGRFVAATAHVSLMSGEFHLMLADNARNEGRVISGLFGCSVGFTQDSRFVVTGGPGSPQFWSIETGERVDVSKRVR